MLWGLGCVVLNCMCGSDIRTRTRQNEEENPSTTKEFCEDGQLNQLQIAKHQGGPIKFGHQATRLTPDEPSVRGHTVVGLVF